MKEMILGGIAGMAVALAVVAGLTLTLNALHVPLPPVVCFFIGMPIGAAFTVAGMNITLERWG